VNPAAARLSNRRCVVGVIALFAIALALRWPFLSLVPRITDETLEVLHSLAIVRDGALPLTNYDAYYGSLFNYLVAGALVASGENPLAPRWLVAIAGALTAPATAWLALVVAGRVGTRGPLAWIAALVAGLWVATNGPHIVVNSHIAWSNCLTPLLCTVAAALLMGGRVVWAAFAFALALQTHPLVIVLAPAAAVYGFVRLIGERRLVEAPLAIAAACVGYANMLAYNLASGLDSALSAVRIAGEYRADQQADIGYLDALGRMLLLMHRVAGGAVDQRAATWLYVVDPLSVAVSTLALAGAIWLARRGEWFPLAAIACFVLLMPAANPKFRTLLTARYVMPVIPLAIAAAVCLAAVICQRARSRVVPAVLVAAVLIGPLVPLGWYYQRAFDRGDTNQRILELTSQIVAARRPGEVVVIDESIGSELPDTGVTELRGFEYLLEFARVSRRVSRITTSRLQDELRSSESVLAVVNARDAAALAERLSVAPLDPRPAVETGRMFDFRLYRVVRSRA
jgi:hypothetical protein